MADLTKLVDEAGRLAALQCYAILDTAQDELFDDFTHLAAQICEVPISLISLVDDHRQWFKSKIGLKVSETPRELAFCAHALANPDELLIVENASEDPRFADNQLVTSDPYIRFYAGAPLVTPDGYALGTLCVIDRKPRQLSDFQLDALRRLARQVVAQLEARISVQQLEQSSEELEQQRRETQLILDHVPAFVFFKETEKNILRVNRLVTEALAMDATEVEGHASAEIYPELAEDFYRDDLEVIQSKQPKLGIVERLSVEGGQHRWIRTDKIPIANARGVIERLLVLALDITNLKDTEESLRKSEAKLWEANTQLEARVEQKTAELVESQEKYEDLYQNSPDMHVSVSPVDACVQQCNQTLLEETGYTREEIEGKPVFNLYHPESIGKAERAMHDFRTTGQVKNHELTLARKDGSKIEVSLNVSAQRDERGEILSSRSVWRDITEQKRLVEELSNHLEQLAHLARVATLNELTTGIAHDLNQPLAAIKNYAQGALIRLDKQALDAEATASILDDIIADADRAAALISSFRSLLKPSKWQPSQRSLSDLVSRLEKLTSRKLEEHRVSLAIVIPADLPLVNCDAVQIEQVLINLILNAAEAMTESTMDRTIRIQMEPMENRTVRVSVMDRAIAEQEVDVDRLFDAFYTTKAAGLGMGLAICRTIVEAHGGSLTAIPNEGPGLTLSFELPLSGKKPNE